MRVNAETKAATRQRILEAARRLFAAEGFDATTTRQIADAAGIATGTLFNYFATKEAILGCLAAELAAGAAEGDAAEDKAGQSSFEEDLFAYVTAGLRALRPMRTNLPVLLETTLSPLVMRGDPAGDGEIAESLRGAHLAKVTQLAKAHALGELSPVALQLYWTLYTGALMFWANDRSHRQEDTLALLDESLGMFAGWLENGGNGKPAGRKSKDEV